MEINKEREAFEEHLAGMKIHNLRVGTIFDTEKNEYFASDVLHPSEDHIVGWINFSWKLWQEKATPEGFVLVPKIITDEWMAVYVDPEVSKYCKEFESLPFAVTEKDLPMIQEDFRRPIKAAHSRLMRVIEAQEQSHD